MKIREKTRIKERKEGNGKEVKGEDGKRERRGGKGKGKQKGEGKERG